MRKWLSKKSKKMIRIRITMSKNKDRKIQNGIIGSLFIKFSFLIIFQRDDHEKGAGNKMGK